MPPHSPFTFDSIAALSGPWWVGPWNAFDDHARLHQAQIVGNEVRLGEHVFLCFGVAPRLTLHEVHESPHAAPEGLLTRHMGQRALRLAEDVIVTRDSRGEWLRVLCRPGLAELRVEQALEGVG